MTSEQWFTREAKIRRWFFLPWWRYYPIAILGGIFGLVDDMRWLFIGAGIFFAAISLLLVFTGVGLIYRQNKKRGSAMITLGLVALAFSVKIGLSR
jgi:hypothetical protein